MPETIYLNQPNTIYSKKKKTGLAAYRERKGLLPGVARILTSPKTTLALGATLATLLTAGAVAPAATGAALRGAPAFLGRGTLKVGKFIAPKSVKGAIGLAVGVPTAVGILATSKTARGYLDPTRNIERGKKIGEIIEDPGKAKDVLGLKEKSTLKEKVITGLKAAGLVGAAAAVAVGGVAALKKGKDILAARALSKATKPKQIDPGNLASMGFTKPQPVGLGGVPVSRPQQIAPGAPGSTQMQPPVSNIIQIQVA